MYVSTASTTIVTVYVVKTTAKSSIDEKCISKTPLQKTIFIFKPFCARLASKLAKCANKSALKKCQQNSIYIKENAVFCR
jgi:hypothetical protein